MTNSPYLISNAEELVKVGDNLSGDYILTSDINLAEYKSWSAIGDVKYSAVNMETDEIDFSTAFQGTFDGNGYTISNIYSVATEDSIAYGLFGCVTGTVKNLTVENCVVKGNESNLAVGGVENVILKGKNRITGINFVGENQGQVNHCTVENADVIVIGIMIFQVVNLFNVIKQSVVV
ncbi:MAG: hypothetical protein GX903_11345 [Spirochaetales bacterium]|nr:hypothetical protein [Spirochaetales bacterium]